MQNPAKLKELRQLFPLEGSKYNRLRYGFAYDGGGVGKGGVGTLNAGPPGWAGLEAAEGTPKPAGHSVNLFSSRIAWGFSSSQVTALAKRLASPRSRVARMRLSSALSRRQTS